ncbi:MAG: PAS domain-containing sensor histidine kinase [Proteobacteria bacterium]|nr:PAS domain-containing sensor histidine kinase [Pseudomonadota bacterium]
MKFPGLDAAATAIIIVDSNRIIRYVNASAENLFNTGSKILLEKPIDSIFINAGVANEIISLASQNDCTFKAIDKTSNIFARPENDNETLDLSSTATPTNLLGPSGFLLEFNTINSQLQKAQQEELMINQNQRNHELIRNLAHEIKNPLGGLRGAAQLLASDTNNKKHQQFTDIIISEADRLQKLLDRLLIPVKIPSIKEFNIHEVVRHVISLVKAEYPEKITFHEEFDVSLPHLKGDREQLLQAILNIVRNASQAVTNTRNLEISTATSQMLNVPTTTVNFGEITISTGIKRQATVLKKIYPLAIDLKIQDNGPGVPEDIKNKIFFPLISGRKGGTGLGLFLAQKLINENLGTINMQSSPGNTVFSILLPVNTT